jgi:guanidinopropionase
MEPFFQPVSAKVLPRYAGIATFMRLPHVGLDDPKLADVDIGFIGVPMDNGNCNRPGARHGPRQLRDASTMIRGANGATGIRPFDLVNCADLSDVVVNPIDVMDTMDRITKFYSAVKEADIRPISAGGDHLCSLPILRGIAADAPVGMVHFDAHTDLANSYFNGSKYTNGTPFRRAVEEGLVDPKRFVQIGIRGSSYGGDDIDFANANGIRIIRIEEFFKRGVEDVMAEARDVVGDGATYLTYDIDFIDAAFAPGTGTPEIGGPNTFQAIQVLRELDGVNVIGADLVEVSPPFDPSGTTSWVGISLMFEMLCLMAQTKAREQN